MIWTSWRLQRLQLLTLLGMLVVGAAAIVLLRSNMVDTITSTGLAQCVTQDVKDCTASEAMTDFRAAWSNLFYLGQAAILGLPALVGVFIGAPLFARELEQGTHVLAFTQSVSRTRWMVSKLVVALVPAVIVLAVLQYLVWWWLSSAGALGPLNNGPYNAINFSIAHASPVGYALFAFALGTFLGVVSRRTLVAMTAGLAAFIAMRFALSAVVDRFAPTQRMETTGDKSLGVETDGSLVLGRGWLDAAGLPVPEDRARTLIQACKAPTGAKPSQEEFLACLPRSGLAKRYAYYIPESQAWQVHLVDLAVFGVLAGLLLVGTAWALRRQS
ncbi:ABC transporter permease [Umezawaea tangerina]|uniref:ABC-2 family transporter n=1 Tax=Umezawaea tangerina TaxID=84725 RepID=A0A2T0T6I9_9PSEU|nr:ABC transporter permease [Umezawaea tangerina]PRY41261.1 ABC-2 family transporter [Umezawaea tangerina]